MTRHLRLFAVASLLLGLLTLLPVAPASAEPPTNDDPEGATVIDGLPFSVVQDTTEATTSALETDINEQFCGAPELAQGVWYTYTASEDVTVAVEAFESDFPVGIFLATGSIEEFFPWSCAPLSGFAEVAAGQTLYILAFGDGTTGDNSGQLVMNVEIAPAPPAIDLTIDPVAYVDKEGVATVTGSFNCEGDGGTGGFYEIFGTLEQSVGRFKITGFYFDFGDLTCDGTPQEFSFEVIGDNGTFAGGKGATMTFAFACNEFFFCSEDYVEADISLRRGGGDNKGGGNGGVRP